jgi:hypothetical protein
MVAFNKQGGVLRYSQSPGSFVPSGESRSDTGDETGSITGEVASRGIGGAAPAAKSPVAKEPKGQQSPDQKRIRDQALANLGNVYAQLAANPGAAAQYKRQYPGMFDDSGNLLPKNVLIERVNQRYGG